MTEKPAPFTAHRVVRAMTKVCAAHEIGADGFALVCLIAHQWDAIRYARPVRYHLAVIMNLLGYTSKNTYYRTERKCVQCGWLVRKQEGTRAPILYTVAIPPHAKEAGGGPTEDGGTNDGTNNGPNPGSNGGTNDGSQADLIPDRSRHQSGTENGSPSTLYPLPSPIPERGGPHDLDIMTPGPTSAITDRDRWLIERLEPWAKDVMSLVDKKIDGDNWPYWKRLYTDHPEEFRPACKSLKANERWCNRVEEAIQERQSSTVPTPPPTSRTWKHPRQQQAEAIVRTMELATIRAVLGKPHLQPLDAPDLMESPEFAGKVIAWREQQGAA